MSSFYQVQCIALEPHLPEGNNIVFYVRNSNNIKSYSVIKNNHDRTHQLKQNYFLKKKKKTKTNLNEDPNTLKTFNYMQKNVGSQTSFV